MYAFGVVAVLLANGVEAQRGSPFRCKDRDPMCADWAGRGECSHNHDFMAESCAVSCDLCSNAGLQPTPAVFQLDFVCKGQLATPPGTLKGNRDEMLPAGCAFECRDNMTSCASAAAAGACDSQGSVMRFQCPASCGVCKALELRQPAPEYPKHLCRHEEGDAPAHKESCKAWAANGECLKNFGFMRLSCEHSCGLCALAADGGAAPQTPASILKPPPPTKPKGSTKKKKKKAAAAAGEAPAGKPETPAAETRTEQAAAAAEKAAPAKAVKAAPAKKEKPAPAKAANPAAKPADEGKKKKGWMSGLKDAVGSAFGGKKAKAQPKDEP